MKKNTYFLVSTAPSARSNTKRLAQGLVMGLAAWLCMPLPALTQPTPHHTSSPAKKAAAHKHSQTPSKPKNKHPRAQRPAPSGLSLDTALTQTWSQDAAARLQLDPLWVEQTMGQAKRLPSIEKLVLPASSPSAKAAANVLSRVIFGLILNVQIKVSLPFLARIGAGKVAGLYREWIRGISASSSRWGQTPVQGLSTGHISRAAAGSRSCHSG